MRLPETVLTILNRLNQAGYPAYVVGGAVRDALMLRPAKDYDICTAARPGNVEALFPDAAVPAGRKYGTVGIQTGDGVVEVTTFRSDGVYGDGRHPDEIHFGTSLPDDLRRRDFTVNAIAYHPGKGYIDPFGGIGDIRNRVIRAVGNPDARFAEDALRILRALRFSAALQFRVARKTERSLMANRARVALLSAGRMRDELIKFLLADTPGQALLRYKKVWFQVVPELYDCDRFRPRSRYHSMGLLPHIAKTVDGVQPEPLLRITALLHDIGKPGCFSDGRFPGHMEKSAEIAAQILRRLCFPKRFVSDVSLLIRHHDYRVSRDAANAKRALNAVGERMIFHLIEHKRADTLAHAAAVIPERMEDLCVFEENVRNILEAGECYQISMLNVSGNDLLKLGFSGETVGGALRFLLRRVISGELPNNRGALLQELQTPALPGIGHIYGCEPL